MNWEDLFNNWHERFGKPGPEAYLRLQMARKRVPKNTPADWEWLSAALQDPERKLFVALVFERQPIPKRLLSAFLHAAIHEKDPSRNRAYIEPCVRSWGGIEINTRLLQYLKSGTNEEKAGAASAFYWAVGNPRNEDMVAMKQRIRRALLHEFITNGDVAVRQRIVPLLNFDPSAYSEDVLHLLEQAIAIARSSTDAYTRHRIEIQSGAGGPFMAIPA